MKHPVVLIGSGRIAGVHAISLSRSPSLMLAGVVDPTGGEAFAARWNVPLFADLEAARKAVNPAALVIASPTATHVPYLLEACAAGLPTLCEKPVAFERSEILDAIAASESSGVPVILGFHRRFDASRCALADRVRAGDVGKLEHLLLISRDPELAKLSEVSHQGSIVADMVAHDLDELLWLVGQPPDRVHLVLDRNVDPTLANFNDHDTANILLSWKNGPVAHVTATRRAVHAFEQRLEVFGSQGRIICEDPRVDTLVLDTAGDTRLSRRLAHFHDRYREAYAAEMAHLAEVLDADAEPQCTLQDGLRAHDLVQQVLAAV